MGKSHKGNAQIQSKNNEDYSNIVHYCELTEIKLSSTDKGSKEKAKKYIGKALSYNKNSLGINASRRFII